MQKLNSAEFSQALVETWDDALQKEAFLPGLRTVGRALGGASDTLRRASGPVGQLVSKIPGVKGVGEHFGKAHVREAWTGRGAGALMGAGVGAAHGAATAPEGARGAGAVRGAILGGAAGLAGGQLATRAGRQQVTRAVQRQAHSLTGYAPRTQAQIVAGKSRFGGRGWTGKEREEAYKRMLAPGTEVSPEMQRAAQEGLTSIPGVMRGFATKGKRLETLKNIGRVQGPLGIGMTGIMAAPAIAEGVRTGDPAVVGQAIGSSAGYVAGGALPVVGNFALGETLGSVGKRVGAGIGRLTGKGTQG
jgi:hypothetical protein